MLIDLFTGKIKALIILLFCYTIPFTAKAGDMENYIKQYAQNKQSNFKKEQVMLESYKLKNLINELTPFYSDSLAYVRQKAYYLTFKKGNNTKNSKPEASIHKLLDGCKDANGSVIGQNINYLKQFNKNDFDKEALLQIESLLTRRRSPHYKEIILLAGFVGAGKEYFNKKLLEQNLSDDIRWYMSLALARMGDKEQITYCTNQFRKQHVNDQFTQSILPLIIYLHQKESINYLIEILNQNDKLCHSLNPDHPEKIVCGYRVMELLAPIIANFPLKPDSTGCIVTNDYPKALEEARSWLDNNKEYTIIDNFY